jgi:hypothetical protein
MNINTKFVEADILQRMTFCSKVGHFVGLDFLWMDILCKDVLWKEITWHYEHHFHWHLLFSIGLMCCSVWFPMVKGVALGIIGNCHMSHVPIPHSKCKWRNLPVLM